MNINQLKGFIAEEIARYHMLKLEYKVVPIGREKIEPELSDLLLFTRGNMAHLNNANANSFKLFESTVSKLPDYAIWKMTPRSGSNTMAFRFLEVKYRTEVVNLILHTSGTKYSLNIKIENDQNELSVHKYIKNLQNLYTISAEQKEHKIDDIEFYIYLITIIDGKHTPLIGKILSSAYSDFYTYLYTPNQLSKATDLINVWGKDYKIITDYLMNMQMLDKMFKNDFLIPLITKSNDEISNIVFKTLNRE